MRRVALLLAFWLAGAGCPGNGGAPRRPEAISPPTSAQPPVEESSSSSTTRPPEPERWSRLPDAPLAPGLASGPPVWTGRELVVVAGWGQGEKTAAAFDPAAGTWRVLSPLPGGRRGGHVAVWTGREMLVWGGSNGDRYGDGAVLADGAAYDPATNRWRRLAASPLAPRTHPAGVWTGTELLVWGGTDSRSSAMRDDGAAYDPVTDRWRLLPAAPVRGRRAPSATWTGQEMVVWGGQSGRMHADGAAYNPTTNTWRALPDAGLAGRTSLEPVWTGTEIVLFGGTSGLGPNVEDGAAWNPATNTWRRLAPVQRPDPDVRYLRSEVWTGSEVIVSALLARKLRFVAYNPTTDTWRALAPILPPIEDVNPAPVWTGTDMLVWGPRSTCLLADCTPEITGQANLRFTPARH